jgi:hypothetical protein
MVAHREGSRRRVGGLYLAWLYRAVPGAVAPSSTRDRMMNFQLLPGWIT